MTSKYSTNLTLVTKCNNATIQNVLVCSIVSLPYIIGDLCGVKTHFHIDTGSHFSLLDYNDKWKWPRHKIKKPPDIALTAATGTPIAVEGQITLPITLGSFSNMCTFLLIKNFDVGVLLGDTDLQKFGFYLYYPENQCEFVTNNISSGPLKLHRKTAPLY